MNRLHYQNHINVMLMLLPASIFPAPQLEEQTRARGAVREKGDTSLTGVL